MVAYKRTIFFDESGKQLVSVQTQGEAVTTDDEFEIKFSQFEKYHQFRNSFGLDAEAKIQKGE